MPVMKPSPTIRPHRPFISPPQKAFTSSKAGHIWQPGHGRMLWRMQTRYIILIHFYLMRPILLTYHHQVITPNPLESPWGDETRTEHPPATLPKDAIDALETMLSDLVQSPTGDIHDKLYYRYLSTHESAEV